MTKGETNEDHVISSSMKSILGGFLSHYINPVLQSISMVISFNEPRLIIMFALIHSIKPFPSKDHISILQSMPSRHFHNKMILTIHWHITIFIILYHIILIFPYSYFKNFLLTHFATNHFKETSIQKQFNTSQPLLLEQLIFNLTECLFFHSIQQTPSGFSSFFSGLTWTASQATGFLCEASIGRLRRSDS